MDTSDRLPRPAGGWLAFHHLDGATPGVVFLPGFQSDMQGFKALALESLCRARGQQYTRFDYRGHGQSSADAGTIGAWKADAIAVLDEIAHGPQVLVGSSMGAWLMVLAARERPSRVAGLVGVAAAPDFTARRLAGLDQGQRRQIEETGHVELPSRYGDGAPYRLSRELVEEAQQHRVLDAGIELEQPLRLIHALDDPDVPWQSSFDLQQRWRGTDVELQLAKQGGHRLSSPADLDRLLLCVVALLEQLRA